MKKKIVITAILVLIIMSVGVLEMRGSQLNDAYTAGVIDDARQKYKIPAIAISVMDTKQIQYYVLDGVRADGKEDFITEADYFHLGSCSKAVLAYMAARLVEEGAIGWNTKFLDIYPEVKDEAHKTYYEISLEDLLACRAGIQPYTSGAEDYPDLSASRNKEHDFIRYLLAQAPASEQSPSGEFGFLYSNASYTLAAAMLEKVSGLFYEELLQKYIGGELGLEVFQGWPYEKDSDQPWGHYLSLDNTLTAIGPDSIYTLNPLINPAGNLSMTNEDFTKFVQLHLQGMTGTGSQINNETFKYMDTQYSGFSMGVWNGTRAGKPYICLDGTAGTFYARGVIIPDSDLGFTIMMNCGSEEAVEHITMELMKAYYNWWWMFWI